MIANAQETRRRGLFLANSAGTASWMGSITKRNWGPDSLILPQITLDFGDLFLLSCRALIVLGLAKDASDKTHANDNLYNCNNKQFLTLGKREKKSWSKQQLRNKLANASTLPGLRALSKPNRFKVRDDVNRNFFFFLKQEKPLSMTRVTCTRTWCNTLH